MIPQTTLMRGELLQITARGPRPFCAGIVLDEYGLVVEIAPILRFMRRWRPREILDHCERKGWKVIMVGGKGYIPAQPGQTSKGMMS